MVSLVPLVQSTRTISRSKFQIVLSPTMTVRYHINTYLYQLRLVSLRFAVGTSTLRLGLRISALTTITSSHNTVGEDSSRSTQHGHHYATTESRCARNFHSARRLRREEELIRCGPTPDCRGRTRGLLTFRTIYWSTHGSNSSTLLYPILRLRAPRTRQGRVQRSTK